MHAIDTPFDRVLVSKTSAGMIHESGPQVHENEKLTIAMLATRILTAIAAALTKPGHDDEAPLSTVVVGYTRRELCDQNGCYDERDAIAQVSKDQWPSAACFVNEQDCGELSDDGNDAVDALILEGVVAGDADLAVNGHAVSTSISMCSTH